jgi:hypothetical protein
MYQLCNAMLQRLQNARRVVAYITPEQDKCELCEAKDAHIKSLENIIKYMILSNKDLPITGYAEDLFTDMPFATFTCQGCDREVLENYVWPCYCGNTANEKKKVCADCYGKGGCKQCQK